MIKSRFENSALILLMVFFGLNLCRLAAAPLSTVPAAVLLPHLAVGGPYVTFISVSSADGVPAKQVQVQLFDDNGTPLATTVDGVSGISTVTLTLSAKEERVLRVTGGALAKSGWALLTVIGPGAVDASLRFVVTDPAQTSVFDAVGVLASPAVQSAHLLVEARTGVSVGVAVVNPSTEIQEISFDLFQGTTRVPGTVQIKQTVPPQGHVAKFVSELFQAPFTGLATLTITSSGSGVGITALRVDGSQLSALPASGPTQVWTFSALVNGIPVAQGQWTMTLSGDGAFTGRQDWTVGNLTGLTAPIRGVLSADRFVMERLFTNGDATQGTEVYQGTVIGGGTSVGGGTFIGGVYVDLSDSGKISNSGSFTASRTY